MEYRAMVEALLAGHDLEAPAAEALIEGALAESFTPVQVAGLLIALQAKGATGPELAAFVRTLRRHAVLVPALGDDVVDTCGTGGGKPSFNLSTAAAFVAAAAGARVAKHGNRAVTSQCGSADVLEALGVRLVADPEALGHCLEVAGLAFCFAPHHHPALRAVGPIRKELGVRTVFNQLGPLANPALAKRQVIGVYDRKLIEPMARALAELGAIRALVVHAEDGLDEISPCAPTHGIWVEQGQIHPWQFDPAEFGLAILDASCLEPGATLEEAAAILREALGPELTPRTWAVIPSAAAALWVSGAAKDMAESVARVKAAIESGAARAKLDHIVEVSQSA